MPDFKDADAHHNGFLLTMRVEYRDVMGGEKEVIDSNGMKKKKKIKPFDYKCWVKGPPWTLWVKAPLLSWSDRGNDDELIRSTYNETLDDGLLMMALDEHRNDFITRHDQASYEAAYKIFVLEIPAKFDVELDGNVLKFNHRKKPVEGLLKLGAINLLPPITDVGKVTTKMVEAVPRIYWQMADVSKKKRQMGRNKEEIESDDEAEGVAAMRKKVASMDTS